MAWLAAEREFGVVIPATSQHFHWLRGTCASIRYFMGDTPICVLLDDERYPYDLVATYGVEVLSRHEVEPRELRTASFGSIRAKNAALWVAPFETFLLLDCDAVVWGDMRNVPDFDQFDFVLDAPGRERPGAVMDVDAVQRHLPQFDASAHVNDYVNNGAYFARRGMLDLDRYLELVDLRRRNPDMRLYGSQGLFNLMVFWAADEGTVRVQQRETQVVVGNTSRDDLVRRFGFRDSQPAVVGDPVVIHWCSTAKPSVHQQGHDYFAPMTYFRLKYRRDARSRAGKTDLLRLRLEDMLCADRRSRHIRGRIERLRRRTRMTWARLKVRIRKPIPDRVVAALCRRD